MPYKDNVEDLRLRVPPEMKRDLKKLYIIEGYKSLNKYSTNILQNYIDKRRKVLDNDYLTKLTKNEKRNNRGQISFWISICIQVIYSTSVLILFFNGFEPNVIASFSPPIYMILAILVGYFVYCMIRGLVFSLSNKNPNKMAYKINITNKLTIPSSIKPEDSFHIVETDYGNLYLRQSRRKMKNIEIEYDGEKISCIRLHPYLDYFAFIEI
jgi:hypothetical protein